MTNEKASRILHPDTTIEALADKYRWHDLRKNPEDLPECGKDVLCYIKSNIIGFFNGYLVCDLCGIDAVIDEPMWEDYYGEVSFSFNVIAWREIEPFEEDELP